MTRLPTGDSRQVPSGVKRRFPLLYTVPSRLENWRMVSRGAVAFVLRHAHLEIGLHGVVWN